MSMWTHVAGCIRIDDIKKVFTGTSSIDEILKEIEDNAPNGSEGGLIFHRIVEREGQINTDNVCFYGDLRDFSEEDVGKFEEWTSLIQRLLKDKVVLRLLSIGIHVESGYKLNIIREQSDVEQKDGE